jgi:hypothetical protein
MGHYHKYTPELWLLRRIRYKVRKRAVKLVPTRILDRWIASDRPIHLSTYDEWKSRL